MNYIFSALAIIKFERKNVDFEVISSLTNRPYNRCDNSSYFSQIHEYFLQIQKMYILDDLTNEPDRVFTDESAKV